MCYSLKYKLASSVLFAITLSGCADELPATPVDFAPAPDSDQPETAVKPPVRKAQNPVDVAPEDVVYFFDSIGLGKDVPEVEEDAKDREFEETESGLKYRILRSGDGANPTSDNTVRVHYRGWLDNGEIFDGSFGGTPAEFPLTGVIAGWTEGIPKVKAGGIIELHIPYQLGYGETGFGNTIPPKANLHFVVQLLEIR